MTLKLLCRGMRQKVYCLGIFSLIFAIFFGVLHNFLSLFAESRVLDFISGFAMIASLALIALYFLCLIYYLVSSLYLKIAKNEEPNFHEIVGLLGFLGILGLLGFKQPYLFGFFGFFGFFGLYPFFKKQ